TVKNNCKPNMNAAVCSDTPLLAMIGMICTVTPAFAIRRNAVPPVRFQNAQERNVWRMLYSSGGRQAGGAHRVRRAVGGRGGSRQPPGAGPPLGGPPHSRPTLLDQTTGRVP